MADPKPQAAEQALERALAMAAEAHIRYLGRAHTADLEGYPDVGTQFRSLAKRQATAARAHLERLQRLRGGHEGARMGDTEANVASAIEEARGTHALLAGELASQARAAGEEELAAWFEGCAEEASAAVVALEARQGKLE